jgi:pyruvate formate lyase activating enzyme
VTTLVIPGLNTDQEEIGGLIRFLLSVAADMPWHVSCFFPQYKLRDIPPTDAETVRNFLQRGKEMGLHFVYSGNMAADDWTDTFCPNCRTRLLERVGYHTRVTGLKEGRCGKCGQNIAGVWNGKRSGTEKSG